MGTDVQTSDLRQLLGVSLSKVPVVVFLFALLCWLFASNGIYVDGDWGEGVMLNPLNYILSMFLHFDWEHFASNMRLWIPFGILFTLLTSNRHVLLVGVTSHVLTQIASNGLFRFVSGLSVVIFAVMTAALVRAIGYAFQNHSMETLQNAIAILLIPVLTGVFLIVIIAGPSWIGHFEHFLGALFGAAIEAIYVFDDHDTQTVESSAPERVFR
jgi:membrane associated rhomboid family serine protease